MCCWLFLRDKGATSLVFCIWHTFFVCAFLSSFVTHLWCVVSVVLPLCLLSVSPMCHKCVCECLVYCCLCFCFLFCFCLFYFCFLFCSFLFLFWFLNALLLLLLWSRAHDQNAVSLFVCVCVGVSILFALDFCFCFCFVPFLLLFFNHSFVLFP